jgi:hypothetical protein
MIALAEGRKPQAVSTRSVPREHGLSPRSWRPSSRPGRLLALVGCARGVVPSPPGKAKSRPMQGRDPQCLVLVALELDVGLVGRVLADHELLDLGEHISPVGEMLEMVTHWG